MGETKTSGFEGGCLCGAVRYRVSEPPAALGSCHCSVCRRAGAAPYVPWAIVAARSFAVTRGRPAEYASSEHGRRHFCARCGTQLLFTDARRPEWVEVTACSADDPGPLAPEVAIWTASRLPWVEIPAGCPQFPSNPPEDGAAR